MKVSCILVTCLVAVSIKTTTGESQDSQLVIQNEKIRGPENIRHLREAIPDRKKDKRSKVKGNSKKRKSIKKTRRTNKKSKKDGRIRKRKKDKRSKSKGKSKKRKYIKKTRKTNKKSKKDRKIMQRKKEKRSKAKGKRNNKKSIKKTRKTNKKSKKDKMNQEKDKRLKKRKNGSRKNKRRSRKAKNQKRKKRGKRKNGVKRSEGVKKKRQKKKKNITRKRTNKKDKEEIKKAVSKVKKRLKKGKQRQSSTPTINLTCLRDAITFTKFLKDNVVNFLRRNTRLNAQNSLTDKKAQKKGEYKEPMARLIQAGLGDKSNLTCSGSTTGLGAKKMKTVTDILDGCEIGIKKACKPPESINNTKLETCQKNAIAFNKTVNECIMKATKGEDACSCFQASEVRKEKKVLENCKGKTEAKAAAKARTACLKVIKECKNATANAAVLQYACKYSTDHLMKTLKQLKTNLAAFKALIDKVKDLTGLSPQMGESSKDLGMGRHAREDQESEEEVVRVRGKRQQQACSTITTTITTCTTTISNKPASVQITIDCKTPTFTIGTCSDADKTSIQSALNDAIDKNAIIIAFIAAVSAELEEVTGTTPSASDLAGTATAKSFARSRSELRKIIMEKMSLRN